MAKFFVDPYKMYYEKLNGATSMVQSASMISQNAQNVSSIFSRLHSQVSSSSWQELGCTELINTSIPALKSRAELLSSNIDSGLVAACDMAINSLLPDLVLLKEKDELYESKLEELKNLLANEPSQKYVVRNGKTTGEYTSEYSHFLSEKQRLEDEIRALEAEIKALIAQIDSKVSQIKGLDGSIQDFSGTSAGTISEIAGISLTENDEKFVAALEEVAQFSDPTVSGEDVTALSNGNTVLYNNAGGKEYGYSRQILTSSGKLVTVFQQAWNDNLRYTDTNSSSKTLRTSGCGYNALASIMSSKYPNITPEKLFVDMGRSFLYAGTIKSHLESTYGIKVGDRGDLSTNNATRKQQIASEVMKGNMVMCTVDARTDSKYTKNKHWVAIVDYDADKDMFYVTDSNDPNDSNASPIDASTFLSDYEVNSNIIYIADDSGYKNA